MLHCVKLGLWKYVARIVILMFTPVQRAVLDNMAEKVIKGQCQTESRYFPRWNFSHGITSLTMLTADEWGGVVMTLVLLLHTTQGREAFRRSHPRTNNDMKLDGVLEVLEQLLCFHAWLCYGPFWKCDDKAKEEEARRAIAIMLSCVKKHVPRTEGNKWRLTKFHELLHIPRDISRLGCPIR